MFRKPLFTKIIATVLYLSAFTLPVYTFFANRPHALGTLADSQLTSTIFFPLAGLIAFTLLFLQFIVGTNLRLLRQFFPNILNFHRRQGLATAIFVLLHPAMIISSYGLTTVVKAQIVSADQQLFLIFGWLTFLVLAVTITSAVLAWKFQRFTRIWRYLHFGNYLAFGLVWIHSWSIGSDIRSTNLRYLWLFYATLALVSLVMRLNRQQILDWLEARQQARG